MVLLGSLTVGICARGDEPNLGNLLQNIITNQQLSHNTEILIVCTDLSTRTADVVNSFAQTDRRVRLFFESVRSGKASAINRILSQASGENILFLSADGLPDDGCFEKLLNHLKDPRVGIVCGRAVPNNKRTSISGRLAQLIWGYHHKMFNYLNHAGMLRHANELFCIRKGIVDRIPQDMVNDDAYMALATRLKGWLIKYEPESRWRMSGPKTLLEYFIQRRRILFGHYQIRQKTGHFPQYLAYFLLLRPSKILKVVLQQILEDRGLIILMAFILEILAHLAAVIDHIVGKSHVPWKILVTTKNLET